MNTGVEIADQHLLLNRIFEVVQTSVNTKLATREVNTSGRGGDCDPPTNSAEIAQGLHETSGRNQATLDTDNPAPLPNLI